MRHGDVRLQEVLSSGYAPTRPSTCRDLEVRAHPEGLSRKSSLTGPRNEMTRLVAGDMVSAAQTH